jgi:uncharacterized protein (TIGR02466 family)
MFQINAAFATPIITAQLDAPEALNAELRELFLARAAEGDRYANPEPFTHRNAALFESSFTLFDWPHPCVAKLRDFCYSNLYRAIGELNGYDITMLRRLHIAHESWFHITRKGGYFGVHNHPMHSWSGVYCVCQDGDDPASDSGKLTFINPYAMNSMYIDMATHRMQRPYSMANMPLRLTPGQLVLFPSWLLHEVTAFEPEGEGERITVAFNTRFKLEGYQGPAHRVG